MNNAIVALVIVVLLAAGAFLFLQGKQAAPASGNDTNDGMGDTGGSLGVPGTTADAADVSNELNGLLDGELASVSTDAADSEFGTSAESDISESLGDSFQ
ncbi:hypothetical protein HYS54_03750 [Candidatus Micrarchaeota archaeon]|nr:hypothetical protein [Candidatus Micrarchaeota archaeon]